MTRREPVGCGETLPCGCGGVNRANKERGHFQDVDGHEEYKAPFTNFTSGRRHSFGGEYLERVSHEVLRWTDKLDDVPGEMTVTVRLKKASVGTEITVVQEGLPDVTPPDA
jgi:uncharacterized protein YndB with AHSA1/START domain